MGYDIGMELMISLSLFVMGAVLGSFACCQVWRMRKKDKSKWSHCMGCGERIEPRDNVPVVSWLMLGGKCRKCGAKIGWMEILSEVGLGLSFVGAYWWWPWGLTEWWGVMSFGVMLILLVGLLVLFLYDLKWMELPQAVLTFCVICASMMGSLRIWWLFCSGQISWGTVWSLIGALVILPGLYFVMYKVSREKWVGNGDWWVALVAGLALGDWWLALCCVFVANFLGSVVGVVMLRKSGRKKGVRMAFGPFLIIGFLVVFFAQGWLGGLI